MVLCWHRFQQARGPQQPNQAMSRLALMKTRNMYVVAVQHKTKTILS